MKVLNIHERAFRAEAHEVGALVDSLSSAGDRLWPCHLWPRMVLDRALAVGAKGGHGPIRYFVESYEPGLSVRFRFTGPAGFDGFHGFEVLSSAERTVVLRHTLRMETRGPALLFWPIVFRPLHDALIEDSLAQAAISFGVEPDVRVWSSWVRLLRSRLSRRRAARQQTAQPARAEQLR